ncbi:putative poly(glycerol-phosphate) alpha-glucosyltransferase [compost metagenome]
MVYLEQQLGEDESIHLLCLSPERFSRLGFKRVRFVKFDYCNGDAELAALYLKTNLFVSTSIEDAGPMMVAEALMCGVPVVTFDVGIAPEIIREGGNGFVVERFDVENMASKILMIYRTRGAHLEQPAMIHEYAALVFSHHRWAAEVSNLISAEI